MASVFQAIRSAVTSGGLEIAPYTVTKTTEGYEERVYPAQKWIRTQLLHTSKDAASSTMFWKLFNYISGQNDKKIKIPMTAPVSILIDPGAGPNCESTFSMAFYIPAEFQEDTPRPTDPDVSIEERDEITVYARAFEGEDDEVAFVEQARLFGENIESNEDSNGVDFHKYFSVQYFTNSGFDSKISTEEIWFQKTN